MTEEVTGEALSEVAHDLDLEGLKKRQVEQHDGTSDERSNRQGNEEASSDSNLGEEDILDLLAFCEDQASISDVTQVAREEEKKIHGSPDNSSNDGTESAVKAADSFLEEAHLRRDLKKLGPNGFMARYIETLHRSPRGLLLDFGIKLPHDLDVLEDSDILSILLLYLTREFNKREKLQTVNTLQDVVSLLLSCKNILVVTGAGISTSLGIPDFRSADGIYSRLEKYQLTDPQELFDIHLFKHDPSIFYDFCKELLPEDVGYSPTHAFIKVLQDKGYLLRQYTQNIDNIESTVGIQEDRLIQCHGSFKTASCLTCRAQVPGHTIYSEIRNNIIPKCAICHRVQAKKRKRKGSFQDSESESEEELAYGILKPDIVFFGEELPDRFKLQFMQDRESVDLVICIGTSLRVAPVSEVPNLVNKNVPQIYINRERSAREYVFDVELLGNCDEIVQQLSSGCGWTDDLQKVLGKGKRMSVSQSD